MGSPIRLIDAEGNLTEAYGYDEFGNHLFGMQAKIQPFGYTGYQYDKIAKTYYAQAREYLPTVGRFAEEDVVKGTVFVPVSFNAYAYCNNNSLLYCDLNGMWITTVVGAGVGAIFGVTTQLIGDFATGEKPSLKKCISAGIDGAVGGAVVGTTGNFGVAGAASAATSTVIQGVWDIADGTTELNAKEITKLVVRTGVNSAIGYGIGKISGILGDKLVGKSSTLKGWNFKYQYADKRIRAGVWTIIDTLKIHKLKFFAVEAVSSALAVVADTINNVVTDWMKKITEDIHIKDIIESVKKYAITMLQDKNEVETCIAN